MTERFVHSLDDPGEADRSVRPGVEVALPGDLAERYVPERELGRGGMGVVILARPIGSSASAGAVAIKLLTRTGAAAAERMLREARTVAQLRHPHIVALHEVVDADDGIALVMEHVDGPDLERHVRERGTLDWPDALEIVHGVVAALGHAHDAGVVHRDVKPANVLLTRARVAKLCDFGLARVEEIQSLADTLTRDGAVVGTLDYMAPEQREDARSVDPRADIYGVGAMIYRLVTGTAPRVVREGRLPDEVRPLVLRCLEERPDARFANAAELARAIRETLPGPARSRVETAATRAARSDGPTEASGVDADASAERTERAARVADALALQSRDGGPLEEALALVGLSASDEVGAAVAEQLGLAWIDLDGGSNDPGPVGQKAALDRLPRQVAEAYRLAPLRIDGDTLHVAAADPGGLGAVVDVVGRLTGGAVSVGLARPDAVVRAIERAYGPRPETVTREFAPPPKDAKAVRPKAAAAGAAVATGAAPRRSSRRDQRPPLGQQWLPEELRGPKRPQKKIYLWIMLAALAFVIFKAWATYQRRWAQRQKAREEQRAPNPPFLPAEDPDQDHDRR